MITFSNFLSWIRKIYIYQLEISRWKVNWTTFSIWCYKLKHVYLNKKLFNKCLPLFITSLNNVNEMKLINWMAFQKIRFLVRYLISSRSLVIRTIPQNYIIANGFAERWMLSIEDIVHDCSHQSFLSMLSVYNDRGAW